MVYIKKQEEPNSLTEQKAKDASFANLPSEVKNKVKKSLVEEQNGLCAYCMRRISEEDMKIEHFKSQSKHKELQLDYKNLLGCCNGGVGLPQIQQTCDTFKGDKELSLNPSVKSDFNNMKICYTKDGTMFSNDENFNFKKEIDEVLNLNVASLKNNRKSVLEGAQSALAKKEGTRTKEQIQKGLEKYKSEHKPFYGIVVYYLEKKLKNQK